MILLAVCSSSFKDGDCSPSEFGRLWAEKTLIIEPEESGVKVVFDPAHAIKSRHRPASSKHFEKLVLVSATGKSLFNFAGS